MDNKIKNVLIQSGYEATGQEIQKVTDEIIKGRRITREDDIRFLYSGDLSILADCANRIRKELCGNQVSLCSIVNARSGRCSEDCKFCAQSACHKTDIEKYSFLDMNSIMQQSKDSESAGIHRLALVTSGKRLEGKDIEHVINIYHEMNTSSELGLCASHGLLDAEDFLKLKHAGVSRYHANIETSRNYFQNICTTHSFEDKIECINRARNAGLQVCSGGIIGMGECIQDRSDMAFELAELKVISIPINVLIPIKNTPFENMKKLEQDEIIRSFIIFRFINPEAEIRFAAGRNSTEFCGKRIFESGANAAITGNMLTTSGNNMRQDVEMFTEMGFMM